MAKNVRINGRLCSDISNIQVPLADGSGLATYVDEDEASSVTDVGVVPAQEATPIVHCTTDDTYYVWREE